MKEYVCVYCEEVVTLSEKSVTLSELGAYHSECRQIFAEEEDELLYMWV